jgi:hypothetical protein
MKSATVLQFFSAKRRLLRDEHPRNDILVAVGEGTYIFTNLNKGTSMKILALEKEIPNTTPEKFAPHLKAEAARVWELYKSGLIREMYFRQDHREAVLVLECADAEAARSLLDSLPLVQAGLIDFEVITLTPYPGFERLFGE